MRASVPVTLSLTAALAVGALTVAPVGAPLAPAAADAATFRPRAVPLVGESRTQVVVRAGRTVGLTAKAARKYRRGTMRITCSGEAFPPAAPSIAAVRSVTSEVARPTTRVRLSALGITDVCSVFVRASGRASDRLIGQLAGSAAGLERLRRRDTATAMGGVLSMVASASAQESEQAPDPKVPSARVLGTRVPVRALASPDAPVPAGTIGWFVQGQRFVVVGTLPNGTRLFVDHDGATSVSSTNALDAMGDGEGAS